ncbi:PREDICTED: CREB-binding protein-like isoform X2 [Amphimedon queenslandica]|uniref:histone acetyltransferase n=1 Tax=Amphimedon queenslandica TaxID=400682 RepID=A0AAN0K0Z0_AMPQE|nr:PREDICTED: CREB-binding protein-like isoform X2 [Amphimedon queenslandica]|eukprot:XP_019862925.1 PREDICTED: CREB-binding protein-like isoform X2 [Amphimedon queenslandica]
MMDHQLLTDTNPVPASKKPRMNSDSEFGFIELPEELTDIQLLTGSDSNNLLDQPFPSAQQLDLPVPQSSNVATPPNMGTPTNNMTTPSNMVTPPINNINSNTGTPSPSNMGGIPSQLVTHGSATPPPNAVVSTSGDPTPTLPSISSSPSHSFPPSSSLPQANATMTNSPYQMNMYQQRPHPGMHPQGPMGGAPMHGNTYGMPRAAYHHAGMPRMMPGYNNPHMMSPHQPMLQSGGMGGMGGMDHGYPSQPTHPQMMQQPIGGMYQHHAPPPPPPTHRIEVRSPQQQQQQMPQLPPVMSSGQPSSASNDPEKRKLIQQQLVLLLHAHRCQQREREQQAHGGFRPCALPHCRTMKNVLNHMTECQAGRDCQFPHCASSRQIIYHWKNCNQQECPVCLPLKNTTRPNVGGSIGGVPNSMFGGDVPPVSLPPHLVPTGTNSYPGQTVPHSAPPTGGMAPNQQIMKDTPGAMAPGQNPPLPQKAGQPQGGGVGGVNPNPMGPAPGLPPSSTSGPMGPNQSMPPNHVRAWHAEVNLDLRNHLIKKLVEAIYPVPNPNSMHDSRVKSLFQYAVKVENMMFENASSREDYYQKLAEKIYRVRKELDEKRRMNERRKGAPNGFPDDGPHPITAVPQMQGQPNSHSQGAPGSPFNEFSNPSLSFPLTPYSETTQKDVLKELISSIPGGTGTPGGLYTPSPSDPSVPTVKSEIFSPPVSALPPSSSGPPPSSNNNFEDQTPQSALRAHLLSPTRTNLPPSSAAPPVSMADMEGIEIKTETLISKPESQGPPPISAPPSALPNMRTPQTPQETSVASNRQARRESITDSSYLPQATPTTFSPIPTPGPGDEKKAPVSKIKPDPSLVKIFTHDEIENALMPVFNVVIRQEPESEPFKKPVNPIDLGIPDYFDIIKNPIDLSIIRRKLEDGSYSNPWQFCDDIQLMFDNAWTYNKKTSRVYKFCSKLYEVFYENIDQAMVSLGYCCGQKHVFHPQVLYCYGKLCPIPRDSPYYGYQNKYVYCTKCFTEIPGDSVAVSLDGTSNTSLPKGAFKEMKNDSVGIEPMVECIHCKRSFHKICVLYHDAIWPEGYQCCNCLQRLRTTRKDNRFVAKRLPTTKLGSFLEERVNSFLRNANVPGAEVTIRVVSSSNKLLDTRLGMMDRFSYFPSQFPYRTKALFVFEEIDGAEVCFFGMHVQEYGSDCPAPNTRRVYISYLDSVHFFRPKEYRTLVYHEILIGYLEFCKQNGFQTAHIWACPPGEGDDYIFHCHPMEQKIPKPKRLVEWYRNMLERGKDQSVLCDFQDIFQYCVEEEITTVTDIPYFEGDFWPNVIEETIKELDQERKASEALSVDQQRGAGSKKAGKRGTSKKGSKKATSRPKMGKKANPLVSGDDLTQKIYQTMDKHKEVFFVVYLQPPNQITSPLPTTSDPDSLVTCELMDGRDAFLNLAREKHWEFSSLRRAKFSTMSMLYELHNQGDRFIYCCNNCNTDVEFRWHCKECEDYDLCTTCYHKIGHEHPMERLGFNMGDEDPKSSSVSTTVSRVEMQKRRIEFLIHACQCRDSSCSKQLCIKMKQLLRHAQNCKMRSSGKCSVCNFFVKLCAAHAQECREIKCPVPLCANLKKKTRERRMREQARSFQLADRRIMAMNRSHPSPPTTTSEESANKPNPSPAPPTPHPAQTPGKAVGSPNPHTPNPQAMVPVPSPAPPGPATPFTPAKDGSSPNVTVQPPGAAMQSPQLMENNIQKLVQALCSPSPQDNLKAKEYLRTHTELVPRVIQGLQYLSRDKEVSYLQQEFGNYVSRPPHPQQPVGGGAYMSPQVRPQVQMQPMQPMQRPMMPSSNTMMPNHYHYPGGNPHMTHNRMPYQGQPMAAPGHSHLQHILQRPQYPSYGMQAPPPQYAAMKMQPRPSMNMYQQNMMMQQQQPHPAMMQRMGPVPGAGPMMQPARFSMHQYRGPGGMDPGMGSMGSMGGMGEPPQQQMLQYHHQYGANTNTNNNNTVMSQHFRTYYSKDQQSS